MAGNSRRVLPPNNNIDWPKFSTEDDYLNPKEMQINIYYYLDPQTGKIDNERTLRTMMWLFSISDKVCSVFDTVSAYLSIMNIFTYPEFETIAPMLSRLEMRLQPTPFTDETWPDAGNVNYDSYPFTSDDNKMALLAMYLLLLGFTDRKRRRCNHTCYDSDDDDYVDHDGCSEEKYGCEKMVASAKEVCSAVGIVKSILENDEFQLDYSNCKQTAAFMTCPFIMPLSKHIYDCLLRKAVAKGNKKAEKMIRLCGEKLYKIRACEDSLIEPN